MPKTKKTFFVRNPYSDFSVIELPTSDDYDRIARFRVNDWFGNALGTQFATNRDISDTKTFYTDTEREKNLKELDEYRWEAQEDGPKSVYPTWLPDTTFTITDDPDELFLLHSAPQVDDPLLKGRKLDKRRKEKYMQSLDQSPYKPLESSPSKEIPTSIKPKPLLLDPRATPNSRDKDILGLTTPDVLAARRRNDQQYYLKELAGLEAEKEAYLSQGKSVSPLLGVIKKLQREAAAEGLIDADFTGVPPTPEAKQSSTLYDGGKGKERVIETELQREKLNESPYQPSWPTFTESSSDTPLGTRLFRAVASGTPTQVPYPNDDEIRNRAERESRQSIQKLSESLVGYLYPSQRISTSPGGLYGTQLG